MATNNDRMAQLMQVVASLHDPSNSMSVPAAPTSSPVTPGYVSQSPETMQPSVPSPQVPDTAVPHVGAFGIKGPARTALGILGDAFLVQGGHAPVFQPQELRERQAEAMQGFVNNPLASIQRMSTVDPQGAEQMYNTYMTNSRLNRMADQQFGDLVTSRIGGLLGAAKPDGSNWDAVRQQALAYARSRNMPIDIPDKYDPDFISRIQSQSITPEQERQAEAMEWWRKGRLDQGDQRLEQQGEHYQNTDAYHTARLGQIDRGLDYQGVRTNNDTARTQQGATRTANDTARTQQGQERVEQGSRNLDLHEQGKYYGSNRHGIGASSGGNQSVPVVTGANDPAYKNAPSGTPYRLPGDPNIYHKK